MSKYSSVFDSEPQENQDTNIQFSPTDTTISALDHFQEDQQKYGSTDPRSDKAVDHKYWLSLLWNAWHWDKSLNSLYYLLHGIRCGGGELTLTKDSFRLLRGDWSEKEWAGIRQKNLDPVKEKLVSLLKLTRVGKVSEVEIPKEWLNGGNGDKEPTAEVVGMEQGGMFG
jgi:hypothetical protein